MSHNTKHNNTPEPDEKLVLRVVEKVLSSDAFFNKLLETIKLGIRNEIQEVRQEVSAKVSSLENDLLQVQETCDNLQQQLRNNNLRIYGIPEAASDDTSKVILKLFNDKLGIAVYENDLDSCIRIRGKANQPRPILVKFARACVKNNIFSKKKFLKGSKIFFKEDLTKKRSTLVADAQKILGARNVFTNRGSVLIKLCNKIFKINSVNDINIITAESKPTTVSSPTQ